MSDLIKEENIPWFGRGSWTGASPSTVKEKLSKKDYNFKRLAFNAFISFRNQVFEKLADFSDSMFDSGADFSMATFDEVNFRQLWIDGPVLFADINSFSSRGWLGDFRDIFLRKQNLLRFRNVSLSGVQFSGTDLRKVEFRNVTWGHRWGRNVVYDEILISEKKSSEYANVEELYRQLKLNYEEQGDFKNSGDFHYGEMEMHRKASNKRRWFSWYSFYWALSGYGERPFRALGWLAVMLGIFTGLLAWAGLEILDPKHSAGFGNSFFYLLQKVTLQRPTWAEPQGFGGKLVAGLSVLLIPGQAALFLLALRNRLGRRR